MINFFKNTAAFFVAMLKIVFMSKWITKHKKYRSNKEEVIILANGPSLKTALENPKFIHRLQSCDKVCVNHFNLSEYFKIVKPEYYVVAARELWEKDVPESYIESRLGLYNGLAEDVDWEMKLFMPFLARKEKFWQEIIAKNNNITIVFFNIVALEGCQKMRNFYYKNRLGMPRLHNVAGPSIMNMIWLNYSKIYLTGVDHSWIPLVSVTEDNVAMVGQPHFYDTDAKAETMRGQNQARKLHEILHKFYLSFKGYFVIKEYAEKQKVSIVNLTKGSFIDAFDRALLDDFINDKQN